MLFWILFIICIIVDIIYMIRDCDRGMAIGYYVKTFLTYFIALGFIAICIWFLVWAVGSSCGQMKTEIIEQNYNIYGLQFDKQTEAYSKGTFILGCGGFNSGSKTTNTYYFFSESQYGRKMESLDNSKLDVYIKESDEEQPNLKTIYTLYELTDFWKLMLGDWLLFNNPKVESGKIITVPTDTIKIDYNVEVK